MERLKSACSKLENLAALRGSKAKQQYVKDNKDDKDFLQLLKFRLSPYYTFKQSKFNEYRMLEPKTTFDDIVQHLELLNNSNINDKLRKTTISLLQQSDVSVVETLEGIITKTLPLGIASGVNKALGYQLIPEFKCMLAKGLDVKKIKFPVIIELKLDGVRCIARCKDGECTLVTREGRSLNFPNIEREVLRLAGTEELTFDGELITESRTGISGIVNKNLKGTSAKDIDLSINYVMFDVLPTETFDNHGKSDTQEERTLELQKRFADFNPQRLKIVQSTKVVDMGALTTINSLYISKGEEGSIVKNPKALYKFGRSDAWQKMKQENSTSLTVTGVTKGKGKREGMIGALICETSDGLLSVEVGSGMSDEEIKQFTEDTPIGKIVEVHYNVLISSKSKDTLSLFLPRFKSGDIIRADKTEADSLDKIKSEHIGAMQIVEEE